MDTRIFVVLAVLVVVLAGIALAAIVIGANTPEEPSPVQGPGVSIDAIGETEDSTIYRVCDNGVLLYVVERVYKSVSITHVPGSCGAGR